MTEATPFLQKYDITFLRPPSITSVDFYFAGEFYCQVQTKREKVHIRPGQNKATTIFFAAVFNTTHVLLLLTANPIIAKEELSAVYEIREKRF